MFEVERFPRPTMRRRLLVVLLAIATAAFLVWAVTRKSGVVRDAALHPPDRPVCKAGQTSDCVGSATAVIAVPPAVPSALPASPTLR